MTIRRGTANIPARDKTGLPPGARVRLGEPDREGDRAGGSKYTRAGGNGDSKAGGKNAHRRAGDKPGGRDNRVA